MPQNEPGQNNSTDRTEDEFELIPDEEVSDREEIQKKLRLKLKEALKEKQEYLEGWQRSKADFINFKREQEKGRADAVRVAKEALIFQIIPVLDSFEMAFSDKASVEQVPCGWKEGIEQVRQQLSRVIEDNGVSGLWPEGEIFNPAEHSAIESVSVSDSSQDGRIVAVVQRGYKLDGRIIRPALVKVGNYQPH